jgi:PAS domain S-box-containing protein
MTAAAEKKLDHENEQLRQEVETLRRRLELAEDTLRAIRNGEVDAVVTQPEERFYLLETAERPYRVLIEQMPMGALTLTAEGLILYCNRHFADLVQRPPKSVLGKPIRQFISPQFGPAFADFLRAGLAGKADGEFTLQRSDGMTVPVNLSISAIHEGAIELCLMVTDLTEQKTRRRAQLLADRLTRLQHVTRALSGALTIEQIVDVIVTKGLAALGANRAKLRQLSSDGTQLNLIGRVGFSSDMADESRSVPITTETPDTEAVRTRVPISTASLSERLLRFPAFKTKISGAVVSLPLLIGDRCLGALRIGFGEDRTFTPDDLEYMTALTQHCGQALERAHGYEAERAARAQAEQEIEQRKRTEEALRESQARAMLNLAEIETVYRSAPIGLAVLDRDLRYIRVNERLAEINGCSPAEHIGKTVREIVPDLADTVEPLFRRLFETGEPLVNLEIQGETAAQPGVKRTWLENWYPLHDCAGQIVGINSTIEEITERKRTEQALRESERLFREMAEAIPDIVFTTQPDGSYEFINSRFYELTGTPPGTALADRWVTLIHPDDVERIKSTWDEAVATGTPGECHLRIRTAEGNYRWFLSRAHPVRDDAGHIVRWFGSSTDIHDLWMAEDCLQEAIRQKDEFLSMLAHELRNPLAPIQIAVELLSRHYAPLEQKQRALRIIENGVGDLGRLLDDLLDVSRITRGMIKLRKEPVELANIVTRAVELSQPLMDRAKHRFTVSAPSEPVWLLADPTRLAQILANLLNNAAKYTNEGGDIRLLVSVEDNGVVFRVVDNGIGIDPDMLPRIFDLFTQADRSLDRSHGGLGIGLTVVRKLVSMHDGTVVASSAGLGNGSEFTVRLPRLSDTGIIESQRKESREEFPLIAPRRILVVEDNRNLADAWSLALRVAGHDVHTVYNGVDALDVAPTFLPHVVSLDIGLPGIDGYEVARQLRNQPGLENVRIIAVSGYGNEEARINARNAGCDALLLKPFKTADFLRLITVADACVAIDAGI